MLLVVCPKSTWLHSHWNPFYIQSCKVNNICTPRHFFFFFANYNHPFQEQKQFPNIFFVTVKMLKDTMQERLKNTKEGPLRECDETHSRDALNSRESSLLHLAFFSGKSTLIQTTNPQVSPFNCNKCFFKKHILTFSVACLQKPLKLRLALFIG